MFFVEGVLGSVDIVIGRLGLFSGCSGLFSGLPEFFWAFHNHCFENLFMHSLLFTDAVQLPHLWVIDSDCEHALTEGQTAPIKVESRRKPNHNSKSREGNVPRYKALQYFMYCCNCAISGTVATPPLRFGERERLK